MKYFIANWKANKNLEEIQSWIGTLLEKIESNQSVKEKLLDGRVKIIICPPYPLIYPLKQLVNNKYNISIGAQDISKIESGTYTGEVTAYNLKNMIEYTILGHSERKKYFAETDQDVTTKYSIAKKNNLEVIYCVATDQQIYPADLKYLCYEPPSAISRGDAKGNFESVESILGAKLKLRVPKSMKYIYGGSVNRANIKSYLKTGAIDGFLLGGASLDVEHFFDLISS